MGCEGVGNPHCPARGAATHERGLLLEVAENAPLPLPSLHPSMLASQRGASRRLRGGAAAHDPVATAAAVGAARGGNATHAAHPPRLPLRDLRPQTFP